MGKSHLQQELERRIRLLGLTPVELSRNAGLGASAVRDILRGKSLNPKYDTIEKLAKQLGCTVDDLTGAGKGVGEDAHEFRHAPPAKRAAQKPVAASADVEEGFEAFGHDFVPVPIFDLSVSAGPGALVDADNPQPIDYQFFASHKLRRLTKTRFEQLALLFVSGDSMEPTLRHGDEVLVDLSQRHVIHDGIYVVEFGGGLIVKRISINPITGKITIGSDNAAYEKYPNVDPEDIHISGKVIWSGRALG